MSREDGAGALHMIVAGLSAMLRLPLPNLQSLLVVMHFELHHAQRPAAPKLCEC